MIFIDTTTGWKWTDIHVSVSLPQPNQNNQDIFGEVSGDALLEAGTQHIVDGEAEYDPNVSEEGLDPCTFVGRVVPHV